MLSSLEFFHECLVKCYTTCPSFRGNLIPRETVAGGRLKVAGWEGVDPLKDWRKAAPNLVKTTLKRVVSEMNLYFFTSGLSHECGWSDKGKVWGH
jgi:hypothetical protein